MDLEEEASEADYSVNPQRISNYERRSKEEFGFSKIGSMGMPVVANDGYGPIWLKDGVYTNSRGDISKEERSKTGVIIMERKIAPDIRRFKSRIF